MQQVRTLKHVITQDVDISKHVDVKVIDAHVFSCLIAAQKALDKQRLPGFPARENEHISHFVGCLAHSHRSIRKLLIGERSAAAVDALAIARLQVESLYILCYLLQSPENVGLFLKNGWKKKYIRFLLHREEHVNLPRFDDYYNKTGYELMSNLQYESFVTDEERRTIDYEQLGYPFGPMPVPVNIPSFPTPWKVIPRITNPSQKRMLERMYPEYVFLCSFAHGDAESVFFRTVSDPRSRFQNFFGQAAMEDFYQKQVLEPAVLYSVLSSVQVATEVAARFPADIELLAEVAKAWTLLTSGTLQSVPMWELRGKQVLGAIGI